MTVKDHSVIDTLDLAFEKMKLTEAEENKRLLKKYKKKLDKCFDEISELKKMIKIQTKKIDEIKDVILSDHRSVSEFYSDGE